jgi:hypothetical protein
MGGKGRRPGAANVAAVEAWRWSSEEDAAAAGGAMEKLDGATSWWTTRASSRSRGPPGRRGRERPRGLSDRSGDLDERRGGGLHDLHDRDSRAEDRSDDLCHRMP